MKKVKHIKFRIKLKGEGIVNFDSNNQKYMYTNFDSKEKKYTYTNLSDKMSPDKLKYKNVNYAKKHFYTDKDGNLQYKIAISSDALRHNIFKEDTNNQSSSVVHHNAILYSNIAHLANILRGYMYTGKDEIPTIKRKSPITITDAEQTCNAVSYIETFARSGEKNQDAEAVDNSYYKKEVVGKIEYESIGQIDLKELQFVSADPIFDRYSFNPDFFEMYTTFLQAKISGFNSELGYYMDKLSSIQIPELGFKFSNEDLVILIQEFFKRLLKLNITRKSAYVKIESVEYKLVYDPIEDTFNDETGWIKLDGHNSINNINFEPEEFYVLTDKKIAEKLRMKIVQAYEKKKESNKKKKEPKTKETEKK